MKFLHPLPLNFTVAGALQASRSYLDFNLLPIQLLSWYLAVRTLKIISNMESCPKMVGRQAILRACQYNTRSRCQEYYMDASTGDILTLFHDDFRDESVEFNRGVFCLLQKLLLETPWPTLSCCTSFLLDESG